MGTGKDDWVQVLLGKKYSPSQPRDESGRFGSGGGIGSSLPSNVSTSVISAANLIEKSGSDLPEVKAVPASEIPMVSSPYNEIVAAYKAPGDTLFINKDADYWKLSPEQREADAKKAYRLHKLSTDRSDHVILHELGHRAQSKNSPSDWNADSWMSDAQMDTAYKVSSYSMTGKQEFVAEAYAGLVAGKKYDSEVMSLYWKWGGPEVK